MLILTRVGLATSNETQGTAVNYPIIADADKKVSDLYGMIHPNANAKVTVRSVFVIDPNKKLRLTITYPPSTGRNFQEILRVHRFAAADRQLQRGYPGRLERWRRCRRCSHHSHRRSQAALPQGRHRNQALPAHDPAAQQVTLSMSEGNGC
jgi:uncharacterized protein YifN (PemK superfamily)